MPPVSFFKVFQQEQLLDGQQDEVVKAPADKVPVGAVPDAGAALTTTNILKICRA